jgi:hypothetical protein
MISCKGPVLKTDSREEFEQTFLELKKSLSLNQQSEFEELIRYYLHLSDNWQDQSYKSVLILYEDLTPEHKTFLNNHSALELIDKISKLRANNRAAVKTRLESELALLERKKNQAWKDGEVMKSFEIIESKVYKQKSRQHQYAGAQTIIELLLHNKTDYDVQKVRFEGALSASSGRVLFHQDYFEYRAPRVLKPGEKVKWTIAPGETSSWKNANTPPDAELRVRVLELVDPEGGALYSVLNFSKQDSLRIEQINTLLLTLTPQPN